MVEKRTDSTPEPTQSSNVYALREKVLAHIPSPELQNTLAPILDELINRADEEERRTASKEVYDVFVKWYQERVTKPNTNIGDSRERFIREYLREEYGITELDAMIAQRLALFVKDHSVDPPLLPETPPIPTLEDLIKRLD